ncbi:TolC family protein [Acidovorax lacteus]|uniref:TolC family protein n=1 Tax=Acidovorax lacteus TaxID=1924988 RepID=UPI0031E9E999
MSEIQCSTRVLLWAALALGLPAGGLAQEPASPTASVGGSLSAAFHAAWSQQPEQRAAAERDRANRAAERAAERWTAEPPALEAQHTRGRSAAQAQEWELGVVVPLWLPRERERTARKAQAAARWTLTQRKRAEWELAGRVREAWWAVQRSQADLALQRDRLDAAARLAADMERRARAGDLAQSDVHQAWMAKAQAQAAVKQAEAELSAVHTSWAELVPALSPPAGTEDGVLVTEPVPQPMDTEPDAGYRHPMRAEALERAEAARKALELAQVQSRANPELSLGAVREREGPGEPGRTSWRAALRWPLGQGAAHEARVATASAEWIEAQAAAELVLRRTAADAAQAKARLDAARAQLATAEQRAHWAQELRGFVDKAYRFGEADAPSRLRVEQEAVEARRALMRARLDVGAAISQWRQSLGLLMD